MMAWLWCTNMFSQAKLSQQNDWFIRTAATIRTSKISAIWRITHICLCQLHLMERHAYGHSKLSNICTQLRSQGRYHSPNFSAGASSLYLSRLIIFSYTTCTWFLKTTWVLKVKSWQSTRLSLLRLKRMLARSDSQFQFARTTVQSSRTSNVQLPLMTRQHFTHPLQRSPSRK